MKDFKVLKTRLETDGLFSNMKQFEIVTELFSSLFEQLSTTSSALQSPRLDLSEAIPMLSSPSDFFQSQRDLFHQYNIKSVGKRNRELLVYANSPSQGRKT